MEANLPIRFWGESILTTTHLINRTPSLLLKGKSPFEILSKRSPAYQDLRMFGCLCYARKVRRSTDKFEDRGTRCIFLGYPYGKKGWLVFDLQSEQTFVSRDVIFHEDVFPYSELHPELVAPTPQPQPVFYDDIMPPHISAPAASAQEVAPVFAETGGESASPLADESPTPPVEPTEPETNSQEEQSTSQEVLGRGHRKSKPSVLLKDYVTNSATIHDKPPRAPPTSHPSSSSKCLYPLTDYVSCDIFSPCRKPFLRLCLNQRNLLVSKRQCFKKFGERR